MSLGKFACEQSRDLFFGEIIKCGDNKGGRYLVSSWEVIEL